MKVVIVKKGMATKALVKHLMTGNTKAIQKQIDKGIVEVRTGNARVVSSSYDLPCTTGNYEYNGQWSEINEKK